MSDNVIPFPVVKRLNEREVRERQREYRAGRMLLIIDEASAVTPEQIQALDEIFADRERSQAEEIGGAL